MNNIKRFLALIIITSVLAGISLFVNLTVFAADETDNVYNQAVNLLVTLGIMGELEDDDIVEEITRADFSIMVTGMLKLDYKGFTPSEEYIFSDVKNDHYAAGAIKKLKDIKVIEGENSGGFNPDSPITYIQALKMVVIALGYNVQAKTKGGYPGGYLTVSNERKIAIKNHGNDINALLSFKNAVLLINNALEIDIMEPSLIGKETEFSVTQGKNTLAEKFNIYTRNGLVTGTSASKLTGISDLSEDMIEINGVVYNSDLKTTVNYLGYNVKYYFYQEKDSSYTTVVYLIPLSNQNSILTLDAESVGKPESGSLYYYTDIKNKEGEKKAKISSSSVVIYNGVYEKPFLDAKPEDFAVDSGEIVLVDNNSDNIYDVVFIKEYKAYVIDRINQTDYKVYFKENSDFLDLDPDNDIKLTIKRSGRLSSQLNYLKVNDLVLVAKSRNESGNKIVEIDVSIEKETGIVTGVSDKSAVINGISYDISKVYKDTISINDEGTYYIDNNGRIAACILSITKMYGYLLETDILEKNLERNLAVKLLTADSQIKILKTKKERINFDGDYITLSEAEDRLKIVIELNRRVVTCRLDGMENLIEVNTAFDNQPNEDAQVEYDRNILSLDFILTQQEYTTKAKFWKFFIDSKTLVFDARSSYEEDYLVRDHNYFVTGAKYDVTAYDLNEDMIARVVVLGGTPSASGSVDVYEFVSVIKRISNSYNEDEGDGYNIHCLYKGKEELFFLPNGNTAIVNIVKNLRAGDVVRFNKNDKGIINAVDGPWFLASDELNRSNNSEDFYVKANPPVSDVNIENKQANFFSGRLKKLNLSGNSFVLEYGLNVFKPVSLKPYNDFCSVYIYDEAANSVKLGTINDLANGDRIFTHEEYSALRAILILRYQ